MLALRCMMLAWLASSRPDQCVEILEIASITKDKYNEDSKNYIRHLNKVITYAHIYPAQLHHSNIDVSTVRIVDCSYAAFASNYLLSSQLGRVIFLVDAEESAALILLKSYKSLRVTRSLLAAEDISLAD